MPSKNSSIVLSDIKNHFGQLIEQEKTLQLQLTQINALIEEREDTLRSLTSGFEKFLEEYETENSSKRQWHNTLNAAWEYLRTLDNKE